MISATYLHARAWETIKYSNQQKVRHSIKNNLVYKKQENITHNEKKNRHKMTEMMELENKDIKWLLKYVLTTFKRVEKNINIWLEKWKIF